MPALQGISIAFKPNFSMVCKTPKYTGDSTAIQSPGCATACNAKLVASVLPLVINNSFSLKSSPKLLIHWLKACFNSGQPDPLGYWPIKCGCNTKACLSNFASLLQAYQLGSALAKCNCHFKGCSVSSYSWLIRCCNDINSS